MCLFRIGIKKMRPPPTFFPSTHGCAAAGVVLLLLLPETMWCLRLLLLVVLLPWSSSVKRERTPAGTPLISECFAKADAVSSATPTSPLPPCRLIDETDELPATETPATPIQDVTRDKFRRGLHLSGTSRAETLSPPLRRTCGRAPRTDLEVSTYGRIASRRQEGRHQEGPENFALPARWCPTI